MINIAGLTELLKGILEGCVLEIIAQEETYGYEIVKKLNFLGFEDIVEGTIYTILLRIEKNKYVDIRKVPSNMGPPRKFYSLSEAGKNELSSFWEKWDLITTKINRLKERKHRV